MDAEKPLIVFDVNETFLDLESVTPFFEGIYGEANAMRLWLADLVLYSEAPWETLDADLNDFVDQLLTCRSSYGHQ